MNYRHGSANGKQRKATLSAILSVTFLSSAAGFALVPGAWAANLQNDQTLIETADTIVTDAAATDATDAQAVTERSDSASDHIARDDAAIAKAWQHDVSDLPLDPDARYGLLANGMRYAIRHNKTPAETAIVRLQIAGGSFDELDHEQGLAHFVEHMAFNGSTNIREGEMIKILERLGLSFGADTNASTSFDQTIYKLDLPNVRDETIDTALLLMRETASELSFDPEAIERERGVVISEMRSRKNYAYDNLVNQLDFLAPQSRLAKRLPIGIKEVLENATAEDMRGYYERNYTPARTTLVIVGDVDVDQMERKIHQKFADWQAKNGEIEPIDAGTVDVTRKGESDLFIHEAINESMIVTRFKPYQNKPDSIANRAQEQLRDIAYNIIERRLTRLARAVDAPFLSADIGYDVYYDVAEAVSLSVSTSDGQWQQGLMAVEQELRRALEYGFTQSEVDEQIANLDTAYQNQINSKDTRRNSALAAALLGSAYDGGVVTTPESQQERYEALKLVINPKVLKEFLQRDFADFDQPLIYFTGKSEPEKGIAELRSVLQQSSEVAVSAPLEQPIAEFAYQDFGDPGAVTEDSRIEDLGIRTVKFANGVRLNIKPTDFEDDRVRIALRIDGGDQLRTKENPLATALMTVFPRGGLGEHSTDELETILAGRSVSIDFGSGVDYFGNYLVTTSKDAELQLQLLAAFVTDPGYRAEGLEQFRRILPNFYAALNATPQSALQFNLGRILSDNDPRFSLPEQQAFASLSFEDLRDIVSDNLANGAIEISLVGDVEEEAAIAMVGRIFGALPQREAKNRDYSANLQRGFTDNRAEQHLWHKGEADQAIIAFYWPTTDGMDNEVETRLHMLAETLQLKVTDEIRETLGASYSPRAGSSASEIYPGYGYLSVNVSVAYQDIDKVKAAVRGISAKLSAPLPEIPAGADDEIIAQIEQQRAEISEQAISSDELGRARSPILEQLANSLKENSTWLSVIDEAQSRPDKLDNFRNNAGLYSNISRDEILALAQQYLATEPLVIVSAHESWRDGKTGEQGE